METTAIILAAGTSSRMGDVNKLLISIKGVPMILKTVRNILDSGVNDLIVVTGFERGKIEKLLRDLPVKFVNNPAYKLGMTSSIKTGVKDILGGVIICLGDMPSITTAEYNSMLPSASELDEKSIRIPVYNGKRGNPVFFSNHFLEELLNHDSPDGCKHVILSNEVFVTEVDFDADHILDDIDTKSDLSGL